MLLEGREASLVKGSSEPAAGTAAGLILIFGFDGATSGVGSFDVVEEDVANAPASAITSGVGWGFAVPDSFSIRRCRI